MEFHRLDQQLGRRAPEIIKNWWAHFGPQPGDPIEDTLVRFSMLFECLMMAKDNWPYYKVWPEYLDMFRRTRLDNIPAAELKFPFNAWTVLLPTTYELPILDRRAALLSMCFTDEYDRDQMLTQAYDGERRVGPAAVRGRDRHLHLTMDTIRPDGTRTRSALTLTLDVIIKRSPGISVEEVIKEAMTESEKQTLRVKRQEGDPSLETWNESVVTVLRILLSVAFIATGEYRFVHRDVLTADLQKMLAALAKGDQETVKRLGDKADRRRGETGHTVGKFHALDLLSAQTVPVDGETEEQRELRYQHLRSGHFHAYWCGPGRAERKVKFLAPVIVRPDLPLPSMSPARLIR